MAASFAKIWAIRSTNLNTPGATVQVDLKRGGSKEVVIGEYLYSQGGFHYYVSPPKKNANPDAE